MGSSLYVVRGIFGLLMAYDYSYGCVYWSSAYCDEVEFARGVFEDDQDEVSALLFIDHVFLNFLLQYCAPS
jgi:hypothetical protein